MVRRLMQSFSSFAALFFLLDIGARFITFGRDFFLHIGLIIDACIVGVIVSHQLGFAGPEIRLFALLRIHRVTEIFRAEFERAKDDARAAHEAFRNKHQECKRLETEVLQLQGRHKAEKKARKRTEEMLSGYKDEVATLNEALKIAANDIAEAASSNQVNGDESLISDNADAVSLDESISTSSIGTGSSTMKRKSLSKTSSKIFVVGNDGSYSSTT
eukprot:385461_1